MHIKAKPNLWVQTEHIEESTHFRREKQTLNSMVFVLHSAQGRGGACCKRYALGRP